MNGINPLQVMQLAGVLGQLFDLLKDAPVAVQSDIADVEKVIVDKEELYMVTLRSAFKTEKEAENFSTIDKHIENLTNALREVGKKHQKKN